MIVVPEKTETQIVKEIFERVEPLPVEVFVTERDGIGGVERRAHRRERRRRVLRRIVRLGRP